MAENKKTSRDILIVEDDQFLADAYRAKFSQEKYTVRIARNGEEALNMLEQSPPSLIILDLIMPRMGGLETLEKIKAHQDWKEIPVVVASNVDTGVLIDQVRALGANEVLVKANISIVDLVERCAQLIA